MKSITELKQLSCEARRHLVDMVYHVKAGHLGGSMSVMDILTTLFYGVMNVDPQNPHWEDRDRLVLSKGHAAPALYTLLAMQGFFPLEELNTLRQMNSRLQGHPDMNKTPGVDFTSGSLGNGLGIGNGFAMAAKLGKKDYHVYVVLGDGELQEGTVWESAMTTATKHLNNLTVIVDNNHLQVEDRTDNIKDIKPLTEKWSSFGFETFCLSGHDHAALLEVLKKTKLPHEKPMAIICDTVKGKGVSFMEDQVGWHKGDLNEELYAQAKKELAQEAEQYEHGNR